MSVRLFYNSQLIYHLCNHETYYTPNHKFAAAGLNPRPRVCSEIEKTSKSNRKRIMDPFLLAAIEEAELGFSEGGVPIGSVLVRSGVIVGRGHNRRVQKNSVVLHAEMDALENAGRQSESFYRECTLYTTLSPCAMCSGAIVLYGIPRIVIGENQSFMGEEQWLSSRGVQIKVIRDERCIHLMREFAKAHPSLWAEDIGK